MREITVDTWDRCKQEIEILKGIRSEYKAEGSHVSDLLYRGQANLDWRLTTTLERYIESRIQLQDYYRKMVASKPQIEAFTGTIWDLPLPPAYASWLEDTDSPKPEPHIYEYMTHLRHHGFPSPLLDWTRSPWVGSFFAFQNAFDATSHVSIFVFLEYVGKGKTEIGRRPNILGMGPYVRTHRRHFLQQCEYTFCWVREENHLYYACHEDVVSGDDGDQDLLWKINIPASERLTVLSELDSMNINAFSLLGSEESLMSTLALREFHLRNTD